MTTPSQDAITLAQISTKLDVLITQHATVAAQAADHETRLRTLETRQTATAGRVTALAEGHADQEARLRKADQWRYAMPTAAVGGAGALLAGAAALITALGG